MPELINKQSALSVCKEYCWLDDEDFIEGYNTAIKDMRGAIKELPPIEPEVRHGRWIEHGGGFVATCSNCNATYHKDVLQSLSPYAEHLTRHCPNCGARMDATDTNVSTKGGADNG